MKRITGYIASLLLMAWVLCLPAWASASEEEGRDHGKAYSLRQSEQVLPLQELLKRVQLPAEARVLEVEYEHKRGRHLYEIEYLMPDGRVHEIKVDALSASIIKRESKDEDTRGGSKEQRERD